MHTFLPYDGQNQESAERKNEESAAIRRWTRDYLRLADDVVITVHHARCVDPGCAIAETIIAVFDEHAVRRWKFARPAAAITKIMVQQALAGPPS